MSRGPGQAKPEARYVGNGPLGVSAIAKLHRWQHGENADDVATRQWSAYELAWYDRIRAENLARREELVARQAEINGPPERIMPLREDRT